MYKSLLFVALLPVLAVSGVSLAGANRHIYNYTHLSFMVYADTEYNSSALQINGQTCTQSSPCLIPAGDFYNPSSTATYLNPDGGGQINVYPTSTSKDVWNCNYAHNSFSGTYFSACTPPYQYPNVVDGGEVVGMWFDYKVGGDILIATQPMQKNAKKDVTTSISKQSIK